MKKLTLSQLKEQLNKINAEMHELRLQRADAHGDEEEQNLLNLQLKAFDDEKIIVLKQIGKLRQNKK